MHIKLTGKILDGRKVVAYRVLSSEGEEGVLPKADIIELARQASIGGFEAIVGVSYRKPLPGKEEGSLVGTGISLKDLPSEQVNGNIGAKQATMANPNYDPDSVSIPVDSEGRPKRTIEDRYKNIAWAIDGYAMDSVVQGFKNMILLAKAENRRFVQKDVRRYNSIVGLEIDLYDSKTKLTHTFKVIRNPGRTREFECETWLYEMRVRYVANTSKKKEDTTPQYKPVMVTNEDGTTTRQWVLDNKTKSVVSDGQVVRQGILNKHEFSLNSLHEMTPAERVAAVEKMYDVTKHYMKDIVES